MSSVLQPTQFQEQLATGVATLQLAQGAGKHIDTQTADDEVPASETVHESQKPAAIEGDVPGGEAIEALPPPPAGLEGESRNKGKHYSLTVSNKAGYMCHVHVVADWPVDPETPFKVFTHPDNSRLFRDIQRVGTRNVIKTEPNYKEVQVEQLGDVQVLWMRRTYSTWLNCVEDARDPECLQITFELLRSDVLGRFSGKWELRPVRDPSTGKVVGCRGELHQDVLPKGMPSFMSRLPVLGSLLRGISVRAVTRVMDDMNMVLDKVRAGHAAGRSTEAVLRDLCGPVSEAAHSNGAVASFAFDAAEDEAEDEEEHTDQEASQPHDQDGSRILGESCEQRTTATDASGQPEALSVPPEAAAAPRGAVHVVAEAVTVRPSA